MNKTLRSLIVALSFIFSGAVLCFFALSALDFDFSTLNTVTLVEKSYGIDEPFTDVNIDSAEGNIEVLQSSDGKCKVVCFDDKNIYHTVNVEDGELRIKRVDTRKWYEHIGIYWATMKVTVYLPQAQYEKATVKSVSGDVFVTSEIAFDELTLSSTSGDIDYSGDVEKSLSAKTVSGDICLSDITVNTVTAKSTSGDIDISNLNASGDTVIKTVSGDIEMKSCDAGSFEIKTTSGDVEGTILSPKHYITDTVSGSVKVPRSDKSAGVCKIKTTSGDIKLK